MVEYILGNYLVESGKVTKEQLTDVMDKLDSVRVKLGLIAVSEGMMTSQQADEVNMLQAARDKRFGDIAIEEGYLSKEQVEKLLKQQGNAYLMFMQALVDSGLIKIDEVDLLLNDFKSVNNYSNSDLEDIKSDDVERILPLVLPEQTMEYQQVIGTVVRTMIRLVDRHIYVDKAAVVEEMPTEGFVIQKLEGENGLVAGFAERNGALLKACSVFGKEEFPQLDLDALDAGGELLNCSMGMYVSDLSRAGKFLELMPPEYSNQDQYDNICRIPIFIGNQGLYFVVGKLK